MSGAYTNYESHWKPKGFQRKLKLASNFQNGGIAMQHLDDRITELEQLVSGKHPDEAGFMAMLKNKFATPEERAAQAEKATALVGAGSHMVLSAEADKLRTSLADALERLGQMEERERKRNLAAELAAKPAATPTK